MRRVLRATALLLRATALLLRATALLVGILTVGWLLAACSGGGGTEPGSPVPTATEPSSSEPTSVASVPPPFDSFHYTVDLELTISEPDEGGQSFIALQIEGDFTAPDSHSFVSTFQFAGLSGTEEVVIVGDDAWIREDGGEWTQTTLSSRDIQDAISLSSADPDFLQDQQFAEDLAALDSETETINGVETRRYHIPKDTIEAIADLLGEGFLEDAAGIEEFEMTVWLEEESAALIRAELTATASPELFGDDQGFGLATDGTVDMSMIVNVTQINDSEIEIEPPI